MGSHHSSKSSNKKNKNYITQFNPINILNNINSKYILKQILDNLSNKKVLQLIKYNKQLKEKIDININDYKSFCEKIEIEIVISNEITHGKFININKGEEPFYHIYFNNNNIEKNRNYINEKDKAKNITILIDNQINSFEGLFENCTIIESVHFKRCFRNNIVNLKNMFFGCSSLKKINFEHFNTENVTNMSRMFYYCIAFEELNLSNFNTKNVIDMSLMFWGCSSLKKLNISNFNMNKVKYMLYMFKWCSRNLINKVKSANKNIKKEAFK